jgi:tryptophan 2,3-dioxygenase
MTDPSERGTHDAAGRGFDRDARLTYNSYLRVPDLLQLQHLQSSPPHPDELQFIIVHQTYELWFKLVLFELERVRQATFESRLDDAVMLLRRVHAIERVFVQQIHVLESMQPVAFLGFRDHLRPASGFQSVQFREVEVLSGLRDEAFVAFLRQENVPEVHDAVERRLREPSLRDAMHAALEAAGHDLGRTGGAGKPDGPKLDAALLRIYSTMEPRPLYHLLEALFEHDENVRLWRMHHVMMVERTIGSKMGTGGSSGARYLQGTTSRLFFPELWKVRGELAPEPN